jgi:hypothetical protein
MRIPLFFAASSLISWPKSGSSFAFDLNIYSISPNAAPDSLSVKKEAILPHPSGCSLRSNTELTDMMYQYDATDSQLLAHCLANLRRATVADRGLLTRDKLGNAFRRGIEMLIGAATRAIFASSD